METQLVTYFSACPTSMAVLGGFASAHGIIPEKKHTLMTGGFRRSISHYTTGLDEFEDYIIFPEKYQETMEQIKILHKFASNMMLNIKDLDPVIAQEINDNLWDVI